MMTKKSLKSRIWWSLPAQTRRVLMRLLYLPGDTLDSLLGRRDALTPPRALSRAHVGRGDVKKSGQLTVQQAVDWCGLKPDAHVLDVGCGAGRLALALIDFLNDKGRYEGFDLSDYPIHWCQTHITKRDPRFVFQVGDIYNAYYNPRGQYKAAEYRYPYPDNTFDFVHASSVFSHMILPDVEGYLAQIARVMKPGATSFLTFLLLNDHSRKAVEQGAMNIYSTYNHKRDGYWVFNPDAPDESTLLDEDRIRSVYARVGLKIVEPIRYGRWSGHDSPLTQDLIIAVKQG